MLSIDRYISIKDQSYVYSESLEGLTSKKKLEFANKARTLYPNKEEFKLFITTLFYPYDRQLSQIFKTNNKIFEIADQLTIPAEIVTSKKIEFKAYNTPFLINNELLATYEGNNNPENNIDLLLGDLFGNQPQISVERFEAIARDEAIKALLK